MSMFFISSVDQVKGGTLAEGTSTVNVVKYDGKGVNIPINLDRMATFYRSKQSIKTGSSLKYYLIKFESDSDTYTWYYPPTPEGEERRNADFFHMLGRVGTKCPRDLPSAER